MAETVIYNVPTHIVVGPGASGQLNQRLATAGIQRPALIVERGFRVQEAFDQLMGSLSPDFEAIIYDDWTGIPEAVAIEAGATCLAAHRADAIISVGGGTCQGLAKAIALVLHQADHLIGDVAQSSLQSSVTDHRPHMIALPTLDGAAKVISPTAMFTVENGQELMSSTRLMPDLVLADPVFDHGMPPHLTAAAGFETLARLVHSFLSADCTSEDKAFALKGIGLIHRHLLTAVQFSADHRDGDRFDESDLTRYMQARMGLLHAALLGAMGNTGNAGLNEMCAEALGTVCGTHDALAGAIMLEASLRYQISSQPRACLPMAKVIDPETHRPERFVEWVGHVRVAAGLPPNLRSIGVTHTVLPRLVEITLEDNLHQPNPIPMSANVLEELFREALG